jgi:REP element-mobilizing transposase RayT
MPRRNAFYSPGGYYHVYNRGAGRAPIFFTPANYEYCLRLVKQHHRKYGARVIAYCLMPNHYHFLFRQETETPLSKLINVVFSAYVQAVNIQEERTGTLFEGRFQHVQVERDEYLTWLCRYIHLNPVKACLVSRPEDWPYSNYQDWIGGRAGTLKDGAFIRYWFGDAERYRRFVQEEPDEATVREKLQRYVWD